MHINIKLLKTYYFPMILIFMWGLDFCFSAEKYTLQSIIQACGQKITRGHRMPLLSVLIRQSSQSQFTANNEFYRILKMPNFLESPYAESELLLNQDTCKPHRTDRRTICYSLVILPRLLKRLETIQRKKQLTCMTRMK